MLDYIVTCFYERSDVVSIKTVSGTYDLDKSTFPKTRLELAAYGLEVRRATIAPLEMRNLNKINLFSYDVGSGGHKVAGFWDVIFRLK